MAYVFVYSPLIPRQKAGDIDRLYITYYRYAYSVVFGVLHKHDEIPDVLQDVFANLWRAIDTLPDPTAEKAWIAAIARNTAMNFATRENKRGELMEDMDEEVLMATTAAPANDPAVLVADSESVESVYQYIRQMDERYSKVLLLYYECEQTPEDIARQLDRKPKTVYTQLARGRVMVQEWLISRKGGNEQ